MQGLEFWVWGLGFGVWCLVFGVWSLGFGGWSSESRIHGVGLRVSDIGCVFPSVRTGTFVHKAKVGVREQLLYINVQRFRGGLVSQAHRLCVSRTFRLESNKEAEEEDAAQVDSPAPHNLKPET